MKIWVSETSFYVTYRSYRLLKRRLWPTLYTCYRHFVVIDDALQWVDNVCVLIDYWRQCDVNKGVLFKWCSFLLCYILFQCQKWHTVYKLLWRLEVRVQNVYRNAQIPAFPRVRHTLCVSSPRFPILAGAPGSFTFLIDWYR